MSDSLPDISHVWAWPPQPSSVIGFGLVLAGIACAFTAQVELAAPLIVGGAGMIVVPDSTGGKAS